MRSGVSAFEVLSSSVERKSWEGIAQDVHVHNFDIIPRYYSNIETAAVFIRHEIEYVVLGIDSMCMYFHPVVHRAYCVRKHSFGLRSRRFKRFARVRKKQSCRVQLFCLQRVRTRVGRKARSRSFSQEHKPPYKRVVSGLPLTSPSRKSYPQLVAKWRRRRRGLGSEENGGV